MTVGRLTAYVVVFVLGALVGGTGALVQAAWFPAGLVLALLGVAGVCYGGVKVLDSRVGAAVPAGGWLITVMLLTATRPEGDFVFGAGAGSYVFLLGGLFVAVMCATLPHVPPPAVQAPRLGK
ncbi:DUF6113 family protein [Streptomyces sp. NPDC051776]|uniref:DUF6113 family protein n=1 Tax=Streptomyces sp. NPDC051776 TaxID=3155414 RepID=UPI0034433434